MDEASTSAAAPDAKYDGVTMCRKTESVAVYGIPVGLLIANGREDRPAQLVALLTLAYGIPLATILAARWNDFDLAAQVWRLRSGGQVPLTPPIMRLVHVELLRLQKLRMYLITNGKEPDSLLVAGRDGAQVSDYEVKWRVYRLARGQFTLRELRDLVRDRYKYFENAAERIEAYIIELTVQRKGPERIASFRHNTSTNLRNRLGDWHKEICLAELLEADSDKDSASGP